MPNTVATPSSAYDRQELRRKLCRDLMSDDAMREARYLYQANGEDDRNYQGRLDDSYLTPWFSEAVYGIVGRMFAQPMTLSEETPERIVDLWDDINLSADQADVFLYRAMIDAVQNGITWVLVDGPTGSPGRLRTVQEESKDGARPYWKHYLAQDVTQPPIVIFENGVPRIQQMGVLTKTETTSGIIERHIVYQRGNPAIPDPGANVFPTDEANARFASFTTYQKTIDEKGKETWTQVPSMSGRFLPPRSASPDLRRRFVNLPLVPIITKKVNHFEGDPPLRDGLAPLCLQHYKKKSKLDIMDDATNTPLFTAMMTRAEFEGANYISTNTDNTTQTRELRLGNYTILFTGGEGRDFKWLEHGGASMNSAEGRIEKLEAQIRQAANDPFIRQPQGTETATAQILAEMKPRTQAQLWATMCESATDECLEWTAAWLGLDDGGAVSFGDDAMDSLASSDDFGHVLEMWEKGRVTDEQLIEEAKRRDILDTNFQFSKPLPLVAETRGSFDIAMVKQEPVQPKPEEVPPPEVAKEEEGAA